MKKKIFALVMAVMMLAMMLTGCIQNDIGVKMNKDGTGSISATIGIEKDFYQNLKQMGSDPFEGKTTTEYTYEDATYVAYTEVKEYSSYEEMEKALAIYNKMNAKDQKEAFAVAFACLPFFYIKSTIAAYDRHVREEMETALSIITTSYIRSDDILGAVQENIVYLKPPVKGIFQSFIGDAMMISSDLKTALRNLKLYLDARLEDETNAKIRDLLERDKQFLDEIQVQMSTAREFMFAVRLRNESDEQSFANLNRIEKSINEQGFDYTRAEKDDVKRILSRYFGVNTDEKQLDDHDGDTVMPCGYNAFASLFERVLPASAVANLYPFNYSGKTDPNGFYIGKDRYGTNILVDFDRRSDDKTNSNILILGNSGQGKSYLLKLLLVSLRQAGKSLITLDAEQEYEDLCHNLGGCYIDLMSGKYIINPLQPKRWSDENEIPDEDAPETFRKSTMLSQHISYLKDFFRSYKDFSDAHIDALEILVTKLYNNFGINDYTDFSRVKNTDYPIMEDLYALAEEEFNKYESGSKSLFTEELLREICLGINSMCKGAESKFFNGHTNITDDKFVCFGVKGLICS